VNEAIGTAVNFELLENYPNPATTQTVIPFVLPQAGKASIEIFDARGHKLTEITGNYLEGRNEVKVDVTRMNSGLHFYRISYGKQQLSRKMVVTKW